MLANKISINLSTNFIRHQSDIKSKQDLQEAQLMLTNPRDAFSGQSRSPHTVPFHILGIVSSCATQDCIAPYVNHILHRDRFWANNPLLQAVWDYGISDPAVWCSAISRLAHLIYGLLPHYLQNCKKWFFRQP